MTERADKKCLFCDKDLEPAWDSPKCAYQPYGGGEVAFTFCFGSTKFDKCPGKTLYLAVTCDDCAEKYVGKMEQRLFGMDGKPWSEEIQKDLNKEIWDKHRHQIFGRTDPEGAVADARLSAESLGESPIGSSRIAGYAYDINNVLRGNDWLMSVGEDGVDTIYVYLKRDISAKDMSFIRQVFRGIVKGDQVAKLMIETTGQVEPCI